MRLPVPLSVLRPAWGVWLCGALLLTACTDAPDTTEAFPLPGASSFAEGTCALIAEDVLALGRAARNLGDGPGVPPDVRDDLMAAQQGLQTVAGTAEPALAPLLDAVVTRAGLVRLTADGERYTAEVAEPLAESYRELVAACTGDGPPDGPATATVTTTPSGTATATATATTTATTTASTPTATTR